MLRSSVVIPLLLLGLLCIAWLAGGPEAAGALAGLQGQGTTAAAGIAWIVGVPVVVMMVPPLLITASAEGVHAIWARARNPRRSARLGSRTGPGDTRCSE